MHGGRCFPRLTPRPACAKSPPVKSSSLLLIAAALGLGGCPKSSDSARPKYSGPPRPYQLLKAVEDAETSTRVERRTDIVPQGEGTDATAAVVAKAEVGPIEVNGGRARLHGDAAGTLGWRVDNAVVFEVLGARGEVTHRFAVGYHDGLRMGSDNIDNFGRKAFQFDAGEVDLAQLLPESGPFKLRVTAIDAGNSGGVSDLYLIVSAGEAAAEDDLKGK